MTKARGINRAPGAYFFQVPFALLDDERLTAASIAVYCALARHLTFGTDGGAYPGRERLATLSRTSLATVKRELQRLRDFGWIEWESGGGVESNRYLVHSTHRAHTEPTPGSQGPPPRAHPEPQQRDSVPRNNTDLPAAPVVVAKAPALNGTVGHCVEAWEARFGKGSAPAGQIAAAARDLVKGGALPSVVEERFKRFTEGDAAKYGVNYFKTRFASLSSAPLASGPLGDKGRTAEITPSEREAADKAVARQVGDTFKQYRDARGGESGAWWAFVREHAKQANRHPIAYAYEITDHFTRRSLL